MARFLSVVVALLMLVFAVGTAEAQTGQEAHVAGALFRPVRTDDALTWHARWVLTPESASEVNEGATRTLRFAVPLLETESLDCTAGERPLWEAGRITGLVIERDALDGRTVSAIVRQHGSLDGAFAYAPPVASGSSLQIIDGDLGAGTRIEVETGRRLERGVGHVAPPGTSHAARAEARRLTGYDARVTGAAVYVRGDDVRAEGGLTASVVTPRARGHQGAVAAGVVFAVVVLALLFAVRRLRHAAGVERADALLASELDALDALAALDGRRR